MFHCHENDVTVQKTLMLLKIELINAKYNCLASCLNRFQTCDIFFTLCENNCPQRIFLFPLGLSRSSLSHTRTHARTHTHTHTHTHTLVNTPPRSAALLLPYGATHCLRGQRSPQSCSRVLYTYYELMQKGFRCMHLALD